MFLIDFSASCQSFINLRLIQRLILKKLSNLSITPRIWLILLYWSLLQDDSISTNKLLPSHIYGLYYYTDPYYKMTVFLPTSSFLLIYIWLISLYWSLLQDDSNSINKLLPSHIYSNKKDTSVFHGTVSFDPIKMSQQKIYQNVYQASDTQNFVSI